MTTIETRLDMGAHIRSEALRHALVPTVVVCAHTIDPRPAVLSVLDRHMLTHAWCLPQMKIPAQNYSDPSQVVDTILAELGIGPDRYGPIRTHEPHQRLYTQSRGSDSAGRMYYPFSLEVYKEVIPTPQSRNHFSAATWLTVSELHARMRNASQEKQTMTKSLLDTLPR